MFLSQRSLYETKTGISLNLYRETDQLDSVTLIDVWGRVSQSLCNRSSGRICFVSLSKICPKIKSCFCLGVTNSHINAFSLHILDNFGSLALDSSFVSKVFLSLALVDVWCSRHSWRAGCMYMCLRHLTWYWLVQSCVSHSIVCHPPRRKTRPLNWRHKAVETWWTFIIRFWLAYFLCR